MPIYNIVATSDLETSYQNGLLPQRNNKKYFYQDSSCRVLLKNFNFSSENRRIFKNTSFLNVKTESLDKFILKPKILDLCFSWSNQLNWKFPKSSIKNVFTDHIFNYLYTWYNDKKLIGFSICLYQANFSHIAYVFYDPLMTKSNLPIRMCQEIIKDSIEKKLDYVYLGRFDPTKNIGLYKKNFSTLETYNYQTHTWQKNQK